MQANYSRVSPRIHEPVLLNEVTEYLSPQSGQKFVDATLGTGGHSLELVRAGARVLGLDIDEAMIAVAEIRLTEICPEKQCFTLVKGNFREIDKIAKGAGFAEVDGILFDLGVSNIHLKDKERGFSFENPEATLDMRLNSESQGVSASDLVNALREDQLRDLFETTMDPGAALWLTRRVIAERDGRPIKTVGDFLNVVRGLRGKPGMNSATLPMLALRIAVNTEIENLEETLPKAFDFLGKGGKLVVISFHSGEDRVVKEFFKRVEGEGLAEILTKDVVVPAEAEIGKNPRARSAKLRALKKS